MGKDGNVKRYRPFLIMFFIFLVLKSDFGFCRSIVNLSYIDSQKASISYKGKKLYLWKTTDRALIKRGIIASTYEVALVTMVYIRHYQIFKDRESLKNAKDGLHFLYAMQREGTFYAFIKEDGERVNCEDPFPSAWATLAISKGANILKSASPNEYRRAKDSLTEVLHHLKSGMGRGDCVLIKERGDLTSIYLWAFCTFSKVHFSDELAATCERLANGITDFKNRDPYMFPPHIHFSSVKNRYVWQLKNAFQVTGLAYAGKVLKKDTFSKEALEEGIGFLTHIPASYTPIWGFCPHPVLYPQEAEATYTLVQNFTTLSEVTSDNIYYKIAGLCASWFMGNNVANTPLYDPKDGSCLVGIDKQGKLIKRKDLKSSALALLSLMDIYKTCGEKYIYYKTVKTHTYSVLQSEKGRVVNADFEIQPWHYGCGQEGNVVVIRHKNTFWHKFKVDVKDEYFMLMAYLRQPVFSSAVAINVRIDGGTILTVPLGGDNKKTAMVMKRITDPVLLMPGLHTVGVRYKGLLFTVPAVIDCVILQPVNERKLYKNKNSKVLLIKKWLAGRGKVELPKNIKKYKISTRSIKGTKGAYPIIKEKGKRYIQIPSQGFAILEY